MNLLVKEPI